jgi:hypothetical protein
MRARPSLAIPICEHLEMAVNQTSTRKHRDREVKYLWWPVN